MPGRYAAVGPEAEFQPGSRSRVLRNRLGITTVRELERRESEALLAATQQTIDETRVDQRFTADDVRRIHHHWLRDIYEWAYISAVHSALSRDYAPMIEVFRAVITRTLKSAAKTSSE